jgi:hypothetical protein
MVHNISSDTGSGQKDITFQLCIEWGNGYAPWEKKEILVCWRSWKCMNFLFYTCDRYGLAYIVCNVRECSTSLMMLCNSIIGFGLSYCNNQIFARWICTVESRSKLWYVHILCTFLRFDHDRYCNTNRAYQRQRHSRLFLGSSGSSFAWVTH